MTTFQALAVLVVALLPGALYTFAYEQQAGGYGVALADRLIRFVAVSAILHAIFAAGEYALYREYISTGSLARGDASVWIVELVAVAYVAVPLALGLFVGWATDERKTWAWLKLLTGTAREPRAWDYLWEVQRGGLVRMRLKSGTWLGGWTGESPAGAESYASGYPEEGDLYLATRLRVDPVTGAWDAIDGEPQVVDGAGLLVRWSEVEYLEIIESEV